MAKRMKRIKSVTTRRLFPHHRPAPLAVQDKAGLWLDLYVDFATAIVASKEGVTASVAVDFAEDLADRSLNAFERRWPTAEVPGRD